MGYARVRLKVKAKKEENKKAKKTAANVAAGEDMSSELNEPRWAVITFETCAADNLTYSEAAAELRKLEAKKVSGLCIITDEAAKRMTVESGN
jgi:hypothetical protein